MFRSTALLILAMGFSLAGQAHGVGLVDKSLPRGNTGLSSQMEQFDSIIEQALLDYNVPGASVGVVVNGEIIYLKGFGYRNLDEKLPVTPDTVFAIGSCTKSFTAFGFGMLVEQDLSSGINL